MEPNPIDLRKIVSKHFAKWYLYLISFIICSAIGVFFTRYYIVPEYEASTMVLIKGEEEKNLILSGLQKEFQQMGSQRKIEDEIIQLRSKSLMARVLKELSINSNYYLEGRIKRLEINPDYLPISIITKKIDSLGFNKIIKIKLLTNNKFILTEYNEDLTESEITYRFGEEIVRPYGIFTVISSSEKTLDNEIIIQFKDLNELSKYYSKKLNIVREEKNSNIINIQLSDPIPEKAEKILNKLIGVYNQEAINDKRSVDLNTIQFLDDRIAYLSTELTEVEKNVEEYKEDRSLTDIGTNAEQFIQSAREYTKQIENLEVEVNIINSLEIYIQRDDLKLVPSSLNIKDPTLNGLIAKFNELQLEKQRMLRTMQPESSLIVNLEDQLNNLKTNIIENLRNIRNSLELTLTNLRQTATQYRSRIKQVPKIERELQEINRQQNIKQAIYLFLLQKREEVGISLASTANDYKIIDPAEASTEPNNSSKTSIYFASVLLAFLLPFGLIYIKELFNNKIESKTDVEKYTTIPILGEIANSGNKNTVQIASGSKTPVSETFRLIRANLKFLQTTDKNKVILVTSNSGGEGKTFFTINLGASLALTGKKVIVLGFDLRKPKLTKSLNLNNKKGITDYIIEDEISIKDIIQQVDEIPDLFIIGAGTIPPNPTELIMNIKVEELIQILKMEFDYIILDTAPIGQVADAYNLIEHSDITLFLVRYNYTLKVVIPEIERLHQENKLKKPMLVLNDSKSKNMKYSYYYSRR